MTDGRKGPTRLYAPWRAAYLKTARAQRSGCIFCLSRLEARDVRRRHLVLLATPEALVMLNRYPYVGGHLMVAPRRHRGTLESLNGAERESLFDLLAKSVAILKRELHAEGFNIGANLGRVAGAGVPGHLHWHVVPRWLGDANFMTTVGDVRVISEDLDEAFTRLEPSFAALAPANPDQKTRGRRMRYAGK